MSPTLAPPAGGFKWRDDEYWNKHEGLMTQTWPHQMEGRERVKNKPITINARTLSAAGLPEMTMRPGGRPSTVPANMPSNGRRFLDNLDNFMGKPQAQEAPAMGQPTPFTSMMLNQAQLDNHGSAPSTPGGRQRSSAERRSNSAVEIGQGRRVPNPGADPRSKFKGNMYFFDGGMGRSQHLCVTEKDRVAYGLSPKVMSRVGAGSRAQMGKMMGPGDGLQMTGVAVGPYTNNQLYGARSTEADRPPSAAEKGRKMKTVSSVIMGM